MRAHLVECHLHRLLLLWVAVAADGINLVDEDDARRALLRRAKELAHTLRTHADEDLLELGARHVEEGHARLPRRRAANERERGREREGEGERERERERERLEKSLG